MKVQQDYKNTLHCRFNKYLYMFACGFKYENSPSYFCLVVNTDK